MKQISILLSLLLLVVVYGCSGGGSSDAPAVNEVHVANWLSQHGAAATADLRGCQGCHGFDFAGDGNAVSCYNCHIDGPPFVGAHPLSWVDVITDHQTFPNVYSWTTCATSDCHGVTLQGGAIGPSCFNDTSLCHVNSAGAPKAPAQHDNFTGLATHGLYGKENLVYCQNCHGRPLHDFSGGLVADLSPTGRPEINSGGDCSQCHPDANAHATNWTRNSNTSNRSHATAGNKETACVICHNLTIDTTPGNNTPGPFSGAPSCFSNDFTNPNSITSACHPSGPGVFHDIGQAWLLPTGHAAAALINTPACFDCHAQTATVGTTSPACQDCHTAGNPLTGTACASCHNSPPDGLTPQGNNQPNLAGKHGTHVDFTATTTDCSACHQGGGTGSLTHYDRLDQTTPDYPADVSLLSLYTSKSGGAAGYDDINQTCSNISCHGGQTTPDWTAGAITVASDCTSCHQLASVSDQYNSYSSGRHSTHAEAGGWADGLGYSPTCSACHDAGQLPASGHFDNLDTAIVEGIPVTTLLSGLTYDNTTDPANPTCTNSIAGCHSGATRIWGAAAATHATDGTYRAGTVHGPDAKSNLTNCQGCHGTPATGGTNPQFTVNIIQDKSTSSWPARDTAATGCMKCHNTGTAHPSAQGATEDVRWYDAAADNGNVTHNNAANVSASCGLCHSDTGLTGSGSVGPDCLFCHVTSPVGDPVGTCTSCHSTPPDGPPPANAPNRVGRHGVGAHQLPSCSVCHLDNGPDGTADAAKHFTFPVGGVFGQATVRPSPITTPSSMTMTQSATNVSCSGSCHGEDHGSSPNGAVWYEP